MHGNWSSWRIKDVTHYVNRGVAPSYAPHDTGIVAISQKCVRSDRSMDPTLGRPVLSDPTLLESAARLRAGDILINSTGTGTLGRAAYVSADDIYNNSPMIADGHVTVLRTRPERVVPKYLWYLLATDGFYRFANQCLAVGSTNQMELGRESLRATGNRQGRGGSGVERTGRVPTIIEYSLP